MLNTLKYGVAGYVKAEAYRPRDGRRRTLAPWQKNLITDNGMEKLANGTGNGDMNAAVRVGAGSTAPTFTDTTLTSHVASVARSSTVDANADTASPTPYVKNTSVFTFAVGAAAGNLTEYGLAGNATVSGAYPLYTHGLFRDGGGTPITIVVAADEQLILTYETRAYIPTTAATASATNTSTGVVYSISILPAAVGTNTAMSNFMSTGLGMGPTGSGSFLVYYGAASGTLGTIGGNPTGTQGTGTANITSPAYVPGSYTKDFTINFGLTQANYTDIGGFMTPGGSGTYYSPIRWQWVFSPKITKTSSQTLNFSFRLTVARV